MLSTVQVHYRPLGAVVGRLLDGSCSALPLLAPLIQVDRESCFYFFRAIAEAKGFQNGVAYHVGKILPALRKQPRITGPACDCCPSSAP